MKLEQLRGKERFALKNLDVTDKFLDFKIFSRIELKNLTRFYVFCLIAALVSSLQCFAFFHYALQWHIAVASVIALLWGYWFVYDQDTTMFEDTVARVGIRVYWIAVSTLIFSAGTTVYFGKEKIDNMILEKAISINTERQKLNYELYEKPYQQRYDTLLFRRDNLRQILSKSNKYDKMGQAAINANEVVDRKLSDTTLSISQKRELIRNAQSSANAVESAVKADVRLMEEANKDALSAKVDLDSMKRELKNKNIKEKVEPDRSVGAIFGILVSKYLDLGALHIFLLFIVLAIEIYPFVLRRKYDSYQGIKGWVLYNRLAEKDIKDFPKFFSELLNEEEKIRANYKAEKESKKKVEQDEQVF